jgi:hypothetical protein
VRAGPLHAGRIRYPVPWAPPSRKRRQLALAPPRPRAQRVGEGGRRPGEGRRQADEVPPSQRGRTPDEGIARPYPWTGLSLRQSGRKERSGMCLERHADSSCGGRAVKHGTLHQRQPGGLAGGPPTGRTPGATLPAAGTRGKTGMKTQAVTFLGPSPLHGCVAKQLSRSRGLPPGSIWASPKVPRATSTNI